MDVPFDTIDYNNHPISIVTEDTGDAWACLDTNLRSISFTDQELPADFAVELVLHELFHAILSDSLRSTKAFAGKTEEAIEASEERVVACLSRDIVQILRRNPALLDYVNKNLSKKTA